MTSYWMVASMPKAEPLRVDIPTGDVIGPAEGNADGSLPLSRSWSRRGSSPALARRNRAAARGRLICIAPADQGVPLRAAGPSSPP